MNISSDTNTIYIYMKISCFHIVTETRDQMRYCPQSIHKVYELLEREVAFGKTNIQVSAQQKKKSESFTENEKKFLIRNQEVGITTNPFLFLNSNQQLKPV